MTRARGAEDFEELSDCFSRLETDIESFSAALSRLSAARKDITRQRRVRDPLPDLEGKRTGDDATGTTLGPGLGRKEVISGWPTGSSLGSLCILAIVAGTATTFCLWGMRQKVGHHVLHVVHIEFYQTQAGTEQQHQQHAGDSRSQMFVDFIEAFCLREAASCLSLWKICGAGLRTSSIQGTAVSCTNYIVRSAARPS